jgi:protein dithiol:quinone oxidoreductase
MKLNSRLFFLAIFLASAGLIGFGLYLQIQENQEPCPLCILQRIAFIAIGVVGLVATIHGPKRVGHVVYGVLLLLFSGFGGGVAIRQIWIQRQPSSVAVECGPGLDYMIENFPLAKLLPMIFKGTGDCAKETWSYWGLSIPEWALLWFILFLIAGLIAISNRTLRQETLCFSGRR